MFRTIEKLLISMLNVGKHLFKKPVTLEYPEKRNPLPENFRGIPVVKKCIKCGTCIKVCPAGAIKIEGDKFLIDLNKCIICGNCSYYCPVGAITMSDRFEAADENKENLNLVYDISKEDSDNV